ncbi:MAG TPA: hypothetical protein DD490_13900 [Acidobacteria bacterium]|nr:hypothetical protein [Acidobacteriota bacterium]
MRALVKLHKDLRECIELFLSQGVEFLVVGGHAVAFHGYPRLTEDVDLLVRPSLENGSRILRALDLVGFGSIGLTAEDFTVPDRMIQLGRAPNRIDLLTQIWGLTFEEAWAFLKLSAAELDSQVGREALQEICHDRQDKGDQPNPGRGSRDGT